MQLPIATTPSLAAFLAVQAENMIYPHFSAGLFFPPVLIDGCWAESNLFGPKMLFMRICFQSWEREISSFQQESTKKIVPSTAPGEHLWRRQDMPTSLGPERHSQGTF